MLLGKSSDRKIPWYSLLLKQFLLFLAYYWPLELEAVRMHRNKKRLITKVLF
jgi:hypothetical protein